MADNTGDRPEFITYPSVAIPPIRQAKQSVCVVASSYIRLCCPAAAGHLSSTRRSVPQRLFASEIGRKSASPKKSEDNRERPGVQLVGGHNSRLPLFLSPGLFFAPSVTLSPTVTWRLSPAAMCSNCFYRKELFRPPTGHGNCAPAPGPLLQRIIRRRYDVCPSVNEVLPSRRGSLERDTSTTGTGPAPGGDLPWLQ